MPHSPNNAHSGGSGGNSGGNNGNNSSSSSDSSGLSKGAIVGIGTSAGLVCVVGSYLLCTPFSLLGLSFYSSIY